MAIDREREVGALWRKTSGSGSEYFTGEIKTPSGERIKVVAFTNDYKTAENHPDIRLYISEERGGGNGGAGSSRGGPYKQPAATSRSQAPNTAGKTPSRWDAPPEPIQYPDEDINPEDIPF